MAGARVNPDGSRIQTLVDEGPGYLTWIGIVLP
jgi:hypothetical protein